MANCWSWLKMCKGCNESFSRIVNSAPYPLKSSKYPLQRVTCHATSDGFPRNGNRVTKFPQNSTTTSPINVHNTTAQGPPGTKMTSHALKSFPRCDSYVFTSYMLVLLWLVNEVYWEKQIRAWRHTRPSWIFIGLEFTHAQKDTSYLPKWPRFV